MKSWRKICHGNINRKTSRRATLTPDIVDFRGRNSHGYKGTLHNDNGVTDPRRHKNLGYENP